MDVKRAILSALIVWILGVSTYYVSYFFPLLEDANLQANIILTLALIPYAYLGAKVYYRNAWPIKGIFLGLFMFTVAAFLDALITVPLFIIPNGGTYFSFFGDPGFWIIGLFYVGTIVLYWKRNIAKSV